MSVTVFHEHKRLNLMHSAMLLGGTALLLGLVGFVFAGSAGLIFLVGMGLFSLLFSPSLRPALTMRLAGARPVPYDQLLEEQAMLRTLSLRAGMETPPDLYWLSSNEVNAFAVGSPGRSAVAVSSGLLRLMDRDELFGVLAHEVSHIRNRDTRVMAMSALANRMTRTMAFLGILLVVLSMPLYLFTDQTIPWMGLFVLMAAPFLSDLMQLALSRTREFNADMDAAKLTNDPRGLASALHRLDTLSCGFWHKMFSVRAQPMPPWLRTHPETGERVRRLLSLQSDAAKPSGYSPGTMPPGYRVRRPSYRPSITHPRVVLSPHGLRRMA